MGDGWGGWMGMGEWGRMDVGVLFHCLRGTV